MEQGDLQQYRPSKRGADCWEPEAPQNPLRRESSEEPPKRGSWFTVPAVAAGNDFQTGQVTAAGADVEIPSLLIQGIHYPLHNSGVEALAHVERCFFADAAELCLQEISYFLGGELLGVYAATAAGDAVAVVVSIKADVRNRIKSS